MTFIKYNSNLVARAKELRNKPTETEKLFWNFLRSKFPNLHFMRQKPLEYFIVDFYCSEVKLIIEIDGEIHNSQKEKDLERDNYFFQKHGITTLRFSNQDVEDDILKVKLELEKYFRA